MRYANTYALRALLTLCLVGGASAPSEASPVLHLTLRADPREPISNGDWDLIYTEENTDRFWVTPLLSTEDGLPYAVDIFLEGIGDMPLASLTFSTVELGTPLVPGVYTDAQRWPFEEAGHPGLSVGFRASGCNELAGSFTIEQFTYSVEPQTALSFRASFVQTCGRGDGLPLHGTVVYSADPAVPEPRAWWLAALGAVTLRGRRRQW